MLSLTTTTIHRRIYPCLLSRRLYSTEPPPAGGLAPNVSNSSLLRNTRDLAVRTPGIAFADEDDSVPSRAIVGGRETRKMNMYQAVRDAMGCEVRQRVSLPD